MKILAAITEHDLIERILMHLRLPLAPELLSDGYTLAYDITGQPLIDADVEQNGGRWERGPPLEADKARDAVSR